MAYFEIQEERTRIKRGTKRMLKIENDEKGIHDKKGRR
jgi:hypothetical protein